VYQIGINKGIILRCTTYQISRFTNFMLYLSPEFNWRCDLPDYLPFVWLQLHFLVCFQRFS